MAVQSKADDALAHSTLEILRTYIAGDDAVKIAQSLEVLNRAMPAVIGKPGQLRAAERQISWGITRRDGKYKVIVLSEGDEINRAVQLIDDTYKGVLITRVPGLGHSYDPSVAQRTKPHSSLSQRHRQSGASIGHQSGYPGTLGCYVAVGDQVAVISAAHVLGRIGRSKKGDHILSPGNPDGPANMSAIIGILQDFTLLRHFQNTADNYLCCQDVAMVDVSEMEDDLPDKTMVWRPDGQDSLMPLNEVIGGQAVAERLGQPVYKMGRTTGLTCGILDIVGLQRQRIVINDLHYIYTNILAVKCINDQPFSMAGDSGAVVYTEDGRAIGLVIAGTDKYTFVSPLDACLKDMNATLLL